MNKVEFTKNNKIWYIMFNSVEGGFEMNDLSITACSFHTRKRICKFYGSIYGLFVKICRI